MNVYGGVKSEKGDAKLIDVVPRALYRGEIYELFVTDEKDAKPGGLVTRFSILGHFEVKNPGLVRTGDIVSVNGNKVGNIVGYAPCKVLRAPDNAIIHIFLVNRKIVTGSDLGLQLGNEVMFTPVDTEYK